MWKQTVNQSDATLSFLMCPNSDYHVLCIHFSFYPLSLSYHAYFDFWSKNKNENIDDDSNNNNNNNNRQGSFVVVESRIKYLKDNLGFIQEIQVISKNYIWFVFPSGIYLFKFNNRNIRTMCEICSKLTVKTPELRHWPRSGVLIVNFERFNTLFWYFYCWHWTNTWRVG